MKKWKINLCLLPSFLIIAGTIKTNSNSDSVQVSKYGATYSYSLAEIAEQKRQSKWNQTYFNFSTLNPYHDFIKTSQTFLSRPASPESKFQFDCLFDNLRKPWIWNNFTELNQTLIKWKISNDVTINLNWNQLYRQIQLDDTHIHIANQELFRFYNIICRVYGKNTVLKLVQSAYLDINLNTFSKTDYFPKITGLGFRFSRNFANQLYINEQFRQNNFSSKSLITATLHEYGQALLLYALNNANQRNLFNKYPIPYYPFTQKPTADRFKPTSQQQFHNSNTFHDISSSLIWFLNTNNALTVHDDEIKQFLLPILVVGSRTSRLAWMSNNVNLRDEFFAEAFAKWLGTIGNDRDYSWELLNEYFTNFFITTYRI